MLEDRPSRGHSNLVEGVLRSKEDANRVALSQPATYPCPDESNTSWIQGQQPSAKVQRAHFHGVPEME